MLLWICIIILRQSKFKSNFSNALSAIRFYQQIHSIFTFHRESESNIILNTNSYVSELTRILSRFELIDIIGQTILKIWKICQLFLLSTLQFNLIHNFGITLDIHSNRKSHRQRHIKYFFSLQAVRPDMKIHSKSFNFCYNHKRYLSINILSIGLA